MKVIHCSDIHLGSGMYAKLPKSKSEERKRELRDTFSRIADYASDNGVRAVLLSGDVFDSNTPPFADKEVFYGVIKEHKEINFYYLHGNHDINSFFDEEQPENLFTFTDSLKCYELDGVTIGGIEQCGDNFLYLPDELNFLPNGKNILLLHGQVCESPIENGICLKRFADKNIDYIALGHIHSFSATKFDGRGVAVYSGCPEGRGYDESGIKGFVLIDTDKNFSYEFIPFAKRTVHSVDVDISEASGIYEAAAMIKKQTDFSSKDLYRINLVGEISFDIDSTEDIETFISSECYNISVKDCTSRKIDVGKYMDELSLAGEFTRLVLADETLDEKDKNSILRYGIAALKGERIK